MLGGSAFAASSVRMLGTNGNTVVGATTDATTGGAVDSGVQTGAVVSGTGLVTNRASSLRFAPTVTTKTNNTASQSYSGLVSNGDKTVTGANVVSGNSPSSRLSIGKYLNLSHSTKPVTPTDGGGSTTPSGGGASNADIDALRSELDALQGQVDNLKDGKQNTLVVGSGEYIDISGPGNNVISIDINALKSDLQAALGTDKDILTEIDSDYKLWWCYANTTRSACASAKRQVVDLGKVMDEYDLAHNNESLSTALAGKQGILTEADNGYIAIDQAAGTLGIKFDDLRDALGITSAKTSEIRYTEDGKLQWRYIDDFEADGTTKKWNTADIQALINQSLENYVQVATLDNYVLKSEVGQYQSDLTADPNGYLKITNSQIGVKFDELKDALNIPDSVAKIEMEITDGGKLRWRYMNEFEDDGVTKKWTDVSKDIGELIDGKLLAYVSNDSLATTLNSYVTNNGLSTVLQDYATKNYVDSGLAKKQVKLTEAENGFIAISPVDGQDAETIGIKLAELRTALNIPDAARTAEMRVDNGVLQWRYADEFEVDSETGQPKTDTNGDKIKQWTTVYDLNTLLGDWVSRTDFNTAITRIDNELAGKQIKLRPKADGYIELDEQTGEIAVDMISLREYLALESNGARTSEMRVFDGKLQWRYLDEYTDDPDVPGNRIESWHVLDLSTVELPLYVEKTYLWNNYYNKTYIDSLARTIENNINITLKKLSLPDGPDEGLYMLSVVGSGDDKVSTWSPIQIVDGEGVIH